MNRSIILSSCLLLLVSMSAIGQQKTPKPATTMPVLKTRWGNTLGGPVSVAQLKQIVDSPLVVFDTKGKRYAVTALTVRYWFNVSYKDEESGLQKTMREFRTVDLDGTDRLNELWRESIRDNVKAGDELVITRILVSIPGNKRILAPDLKATIRE